MSDEQHVGTATKESRAKRLPPGKLDIVYRFGFPPFWRRNPEDWVVKPEETRRWRRLSKSQQSRPHPH